MTMAQILLISASGLGVAGLALLAAILLGSAAEDRDISAHLRGVASAAQRRPTAAPASAARLLAPLQALGAFVRRRVGIDETETAALQRWALAAGFDPRVAVNALVGAKALLMMAMPLVALTYSMFTDADAVESLVAIGVSLAGAVVLPGWVIGRLQGPFIRSLTKGLPDALDLMVVAAEAGLGLEAAIDRVAREMAGSNPPISIELGTLVQEMRMLPDRGTALERMGSRTGLGSFQRLGTSLAQTLRFGTPLAQALRLLAAEMRQERMLRIEEKAIRLPALLVGPLILFILPALFIALIGPSALEIGRQFSGSMQ